MTKCVPVFSKTGIITQAYTGVCLVAPYEGALWARQGTSPTDNTNPWTALSSGEQSSGFFGYESTNLYLMGGGTAILYPLAEAPPVTPDAIIAQYGTGRWDSFDVTSFVQNVRQGTLWDAWKDNLGGLTAVSPGTNAYHGIDLAHPPFYRETALVPGTAVFDASTSTIPWPSLSTGPFEIWMTLSSERAVQSSGSLFSLTLRGTNPAGPASGYFVSITASGALQTSAGSGAAQVASNFLPTDGKLHVVRIVLDGDGGRVMRVIGYVDGVKKVDRTTNHVYAQRFATVLTQVQFAFTGLTNMFLIANSIPDNTALQLLQGLVQQGRTF